MLAGGSPWGGPISPGLQRRKLRLRDSRGHSALLAHAARWRGATVLSRGLGSSHRPSCCRAPASSTENSSPSFLTPCDFATPGFPSGAADAAYAGWQPATLPRPGWERKAKGPRGGAPASSKASRGGACGASSAPAGWGTPVAQLNKRAPGAPGGPLELLGRSARPAPDHLSSSW